MSRGKNSRRTQKNLAKTTVVAQEKKVEEKTAAETVKETVQPVKKEEVKPVAEKTETVKTEPVKATVKTEKKVQPKESKPVAKAAEKPVAKTTEKETKVTAKTTKKTTARKAAKKPVEKITEVLKEDNSIKLVHIQRSTGYGWRNSFLVSELGEIIKVVKSIREDVVVFVDNCYGEFIDTIEPTDVGADLIAGSLIKNAGGGIAPTGGYIVGKSKYVEQASYRLTTPGIGGECGSTFGVMRQLFQGLFLAPHIAMEAVKGAIFCSRIMELAGFEVLPKYTDKRSDIIQAIKFGNKENLINFCKGIQKGSPIDSFVECEPWAMPGYTDEVIMAAGAFIQGSSIELSADAPIREPYIAYLQGGLTFDHAKIGVLLALNNII